MYELSDSDGSFGYGETFGEDGDFTDPSSRKNIIKRLIKKADSVPLTKLFNYYSIRLDQYTRKTICPFKSHKGGHERSPSFYYYPDSNSFRCYGCASGNPYTHGVDFVSIMEGISKSKAALKIIKLFETDVDENASFLEKDDFSERLQIMMIFGNTAREFRLVHNEMVSEQFIENICHIYDTMNAKRDFNNEALRFVTEQLLEKIKNYELSIV